jgi:hypothetical protein
MISAAFQLSLTPLTKVIAFAKIAIISRNMKLLLLGLVHYRGVTLYQGAPGSNFRRPPCRSAKGTGRVLYMHVFSRGSRACSSGKCLNLDSLI